MTDYVQLALNKFMSGWVTGTVSTNQLSFEHPNSSNADRIKFNNTELDLASATFNQKYNATTHRDSVIDAIVAKAKSIHAQGGTMSSWIASSIIQGVPTETDQRVYQSPAYIGVRYNTSAGALQLQNQRDISMANATGGDRMVAFHPDTPTQIHDTLMQPVPSNNSMSTATIAAIGVAAYLILR